MTTRREFLALAGRLGVGAVSLGGLLSPRPAPAVAGMPRTIELETREVKWELAPGKVIKAMAYNGQVPGPELRVREGERLRIVLTNALGEPTTVHWHGVNVPNAMDGVPDLTQKAVPAGGAFVYEFEAHPSGTRWYHTHFREYRQMDLGLAAPLIIEPEGKEPFPVDRDYTMVLDDWATGTGPALPETAGGTAGARGEMGGMMRGMGGMMRGMGGGMMGGKSQDEPAYDVMTINGKAYPATEPLRVRKGERVRLRLINASNEHTHVVRLAGHTLRVIHTDGNPLTQPVEVDAVPIAPSERYDLLVTANRPGAWLFYCAQPGHARAGEQALVVYDGAGRSRPDPPTEGVAGLRLWRYPMGRGRDVLPPSSGSLRTFTQTLSGGMMGGPDIWTINGRQYPNTDPIRVHKGDPVRLRLGNMSMEAHPMHLHGQSFKVLAVNGQRLAAPLVKDSVDVEAHMSTVEIEFTAHNPGDWLFHCHKPMHMEGGMIALVKIAG